ncbi:winged helix-turn-helix transcriptional regulator [Haloarcula sp. JP-L23]|uniref:winged helix-turn-helix transcriptional regulator n=1 Tax=Haloarcula sp. JP-L23 TaxID=2716717 RepID=UPI001D0392F6
MTDRPGPNPSVDDETLIRTILEAYPPALGTSDVAEKVGLSSEATRRHLGRLEEEGYLSTDMLGSVRVWWVTDVGRAYLSGEGESSTQ